jgi:hypothetical protein
MLRSCRSGSIRNEHRGRKNPRRPSKGSRDESIVIVRLLKRIDDLPPHWRLGSVECLDLKFDVGAVGLLDNAIDTFEINYRRIRDDSLLQQFAEDMKFSSFSGCTAGYRYQVLVPSSFEDST